MTKNTYNKYLHLIKGRLWQEQEIISFRKLLRESFCLGGECSWDGRTNRLVAQELLDKFNNTVNKRPYRISQEQTEKGLNWLRQACFTGRGVVRESKSRPFEWWECEKLKTMLPKFSHWTFDGLEPEYNNYTGTIMGFSPIYTLHAGRKNQFTYVAHPMGYERGCRVTHLQTA
jgi:hypothetical protein